MNACSLLPTLQPLFERLLEMSLYKRKVHYPNKERFLSSVFRFLTKWKADGVSLGQLDVWDQFPLWLVA